MRHTPVLLLAAALGLACSSAAMATTGLSVVTVGSLRATVYDVHVEHDAQGATVSGLVRKGPATGARRLYGSIRLEVLDDAGRLVSVRHAEPRRTTLGRHSHRARFEVALGRLPSQAASLRLAYH